MLLKPMSFVGVRVALNVLAKLCDTPASVSIVPNFIAIELLHTRWSNANGMLAVSMFKNSH